MRKIWNQSFLILSVFILTVFAMPERSRAALDVQASAMAASSSKIKVQWNDVDGASGYAVYRSASADSGFQKLTTASGTSYTDSSVSAAVNYYYKIVPVSRETGKEMKKAGSTAKAKTPAKISIEKVQAKSSTKIAVRWQASAGSGGYIIYRSLSEHGGYSEIGRVDGKTETSYQDTEIVPGETYYYKIRPTNQKHKGLGSYSDPAKGRTMAKASITSIASLSSSKIQITWKKVGNAASYDVYRAASEKGTYKKIATVKKNVRQYTDQSVKSGKRYYYKVVASGTFEGARITGGYSDPVSFQALNQVKISSVKVTPDDGLKIRWSKVSGATKYKIYRAQSKQGQYKAVATVKGASAVTYTDTKIIPGKTYYYKVQAYSDNNGIVIAGSGTKSEAKGAATGYTIMGDTTVTAAQMQALYTASGKKYPASVYKDKGAKNLAKFCEIVIDECEKEGIRAEVVFAQICLETGYLSFGGQVSSDQCNFAGIGATDDGASGAVFPSVKIGIRAQVQHLKGYASKEDLNQACVDPRFQYLSLRRGVAKHVQDLGGGNWATDPAYALKLMNLIRTMQSY